MKLVNTLLKNASFPNQISKKQQLNNALKNLCALRFKHVKIDKIKYRV